LQQSRCSPCSSSTRGYFLAMDSTLLIAWLPVPSSCGRGARAQARRGRARAAGTRSRLVALVQRAQRVHPRQRRRLAVRDVRHAHFLRTRGGAAASLSAARGATNPGVPPVRALRRRRSLGRALRECTAPLSLPATCARLGLEAGVVVRAPVCVICTRGWHCHGSPAGRAGCPRRVNAHAPRPAPRFVRPSRPAARRASYSTAAPRALRESFLIGTPTACHVTACREINPYYPAQPPAVRDAVEAARAAVAERRHARAAGAACAALWLAARGVAA
jgi:hypothetical protein